MNMEWKEKETMAPASNVGAGSFPARRSLSWSDDGKFSPKGGGASPGGVNTKVSAAWKRGAQMCASTTLSSSPKLWVDVDVELCGSSVRKHYTLPVPGPSIDRSIDRFIKKLNQTPTCGASPAAARG